MTKSEIISLVISLLAVAVTLVSYYFYIKQKLRESALNAINSAENADAAGAEKMRLAVDQVYALVPPLLKPVISRELVGQLIQAVFDKMQEFAKKNLQKKLSQDTLTDK